MLKFVVRNAARKLRSILHGLGGKVYLLSPKQTGGKLWRFAYAYQGHLILVGKGVANRTIGRNAVDRFGSKPVEWNKRYVKVLREQLMRDAA